MPSEVKSAGGGDCSSYTLAGFAGERINNKTDAVAKRGNNPVARNAGA